MFNTNRVTSLLGWEVATCNYTDDSTDHISRSRPDILVCIIPDAMVGIVSPLTEYFNLDRD